MSNEDVLAKIIIYIEIFYRFFMHLPLDNALKENMISVNELYEPMMAHKPIISRVCNFPRQRTKMMEIVPAEAGLIRIWVMCWR